MSVSETTPRRKSAYSRRKIDAILHAARQLFIEQGFAGASMDNVAARAGVGKATVYAHFGNKEDLFAAIIGLESSEHSIALSSSKKERFAKRLMDVALEAFELLVSPTSVAVFRMVAAEAARHPHLGKMFYEIGPVILNQRIGAFLKGAMDRGEIREADPYLAATHLLGLITSDLQVRALLGVETKMTGKKKRRIVTAGVEGFLAGYVAPAPRRVRQPRGSPGQGV